MKQFFNSNLTDRESNKTKSNGEAEKKKVDVKKNAKISQQKKKVVQKIPRSSAAAIHEKMKNSLQN